MGCDEPKETIRPEKDRRDIITILKEIRENTGGKPNG